MNISNAYLPFESNIWSKSLAALLAHDTNWPTVFQCSMQIFFNSASFNICLKFKYYFRQNHGLVVDFIPVFFVLCTLTLTLIQPNQFLKQCNY